MLTVVIMFKGEELKPQPWGVGGVRRVDGGWTKDGWGGWRLEHWGEPDGGWHVVYRAHSGGDYPMELDRFHSSPVVLDGVMQVAGKLWPTDACLAGLVRALNDILHPQRRRTYARAGRTRS
jgi:hypothetical protein